MNYVLKQSFHEEPYLSVVPSSTLCRKYSGSGQRGRYAWIRGATALGVKCLDREVNDASLPNLINMEEVKTNTPKI